MADKGNILMISSGIALKDNPWGGSRRMHYLADTLEKNGENVVTLSNEYSNPSFLGRIDKRRLQDRNGSILECIRKNGAKKVIISSPSFELFSIAKDIKENDESIKIIFDCCEPWHLRKGRKETTYLEEKKYLQYADCIVFCSEILMLDMCKAFEINMNKTAVIYTGYSEEEWGKAEENGDKNEPENKQLTITYVGSMGLDGSKKNGKKKNDRNYRGLHTLIKAIEKQPKDMVELKLVDSNCIEGMERRNNIKYIGKATQEEAVYHMLESDILLNVQDSDGNSDKYLVPEEFYDYMRSGKAIWSIGRGDGLAAKLLGEYDIGITCENDAERIEEVLEGLIAWKRLGRIGELRNGGGKDITGFSWERQGREYVKVLGEF